MALPDTQFQAPLVYSLEQVKLLDENAIASVGTLEDGWFCAADLIAENSVALEQALERQAVEHPRMDTRTKGSYFIGDYAWYVAAAAIGAYLAARRVPELAPENIALRYQTYTWHEGEESGDAERIELRFLSPRCAVLADDPLAAHPDAVTLPDAAALREWMRASLEAHFSPLIEQVYKRTRLGRHAQWSLVADSCAARFLHLAQTLGDEARGTDEGLAFVKVAGSALKNPKTGYFTVDYQGHCETFRARGGCCRYYTMSDTGEKCSTCVLRTPEDRDQLFLAYMAERHAKTVS